MQRSELAEDATASQATARPDGRTTEKTSDESADAADPAEETALDEPIEHESHTRTDPANSAEGITVGEPGTEEQPSPDSQVTEDTALPASEATAGDADPAAEAESATEGEAEAEGVAPPQPSKPSPRPTPNGAPAEAEPASDTEPAASAEPVGQTEPAGEARPPGSAPPAGDAEPQAEPDAGAPARPSKPSPRPRSAPADPPLEGEQAAEAAADDPTVSDAPAAQRPFKPSPRPRSAQADPPVEPATQADQPAEGTVPTEHQQPAVAEQAPPAEPDQVSAPVSSPGWAHLAEDDHSTDPETIDEPVKDPAAVATTRKRWRRGIVFTVATIALMLFIPAFIVRMYGIPSESMETTLHGCAGCDNDRVLVDRTVYRFRNPHPGEVVVFTAGPEIWGNSEEQIPGESNPLIKGLRSIGEMVGIAPPSGPDFVKRVIAVGGQTVSCCDSRNRILVDGVSVDEPYVYYSFAAGPAKQAPFPKIKVPDGTMWMMGDNRNASLDSRAPGNGPVPVSALAGKVRMIIYPLSRLGSVDDTNPQVPR